MSKIINIECSCGKVQGEIAVVKNDFFHVHCLCCDCQNFASHLNNQDKILDKHGGTELFQTFPEYLTITKGNENIGCVQHNSKGIYRWHTNCCNMPIANTMTNAKMPFIGVSVKLMKFENEQEKYNSLGPITMKAFGKYAIGEMPKDTHPTFPLSFMPKILGFMIKGYLKKKYTPSVFFSNGKPITEAKIIN